MERDHLRRLQELVGAATAGDGVQRAAVLMELQRVSALALRDMVAEAREQGVSWRELAEDLGVATTTLHGQYRSGRGVVLVSHTGAVAPSTEPPNSAGSSDEPDTHDAARPGELPAAGLDQFVGRERELSDLRPLITRSRLVTITGPAGVGKTRLATEFVHHSRRSHRGGLWWVSLAPLPPDTPVENAVATALTGAGGEGQGGVEDILAAVSRRGTSLLVLDNCEHRVDHSAHLASRLLAACPRLRILTTSREALRVPGESTYPLAPLATPTGDVASTDLRTLPAVRLFTVRARAVHPGFELTDELLPIVARLCTRLDGLPLAIELAARQTGVLTPAQLLDRLEEGLNLLSGGLRDAPAHHHSLRAAIEWSYDFLDADEQAAFRRLALLPGGFDEHTAAAVCGATDAKAVWPVLAALTAKCVVLPDRPAGAPGRFRILESLRSFGRERLEAAGELADVQDRLMTWLTDVTQQSSAESLTSEEVMTRRDEELHNLQYAVHVAEQAGDDRYPVLALALANARRHRGELAQARDLFEQLLPYAESTSALIPIELAILLLLRGDDYETARSHAEHGLQLARRDGHPAWQNRALAVLAQAEHCLGNESAALALKKEVVQNLRSAGNSPVLAQALSFVAWQLVTTNQLQPAADAIDEAIDVLDPYLDNPSTNAILHTAGTIALKRDQLDQARGYYSLALARQTMEPNERPLCLEGLALVAVASGEPERALRLFAAAAALRTRYDVTSEPWWSRLCADTAAEAEDRLRERQVAAARAEGAALDADQAVTYALVGKLPGPAPRRDAMTLSAREYEVAELVAKGLSNPQIAARLHISARTVASHVEKIRTKLDLPTRVHITAWITQAAQKEPP